MMNSDPKEVDEPTQFDKMSLAAVVGKVIAE
jgi:hypothetical protein